MWLCKWIGYASFFAFGMVAAATEHHITGWEFWTFLGLMAIASGAAHVEGMYEGREELQNTGTWDGRHN